MDIISYYCIISLIENWLLQLNRLIQLFPLPQSFAFVVFLCIVCIMLLNFNITDFNDSYVLYCEL